jgi:formate dehydrogenase iron-sulfur subunit
VTSNQDPPKFSTAMRGDSDPAAQGGYGEHPPRMGFFTDTSVCIGCKACEVACKEWNAIPDNGLLFTGMSYDNTVGLGADTWRHVAFIEQNKPIAAQDAGLTHIRGAIPPENPPTELAGPSASGVDALAEAGALSEHSEG